LQESTARTEQLTSAVQLLGNEHEAVRVGGLYALLQYAQEHEDERRDILRMVSQYVRSAAPAQLQDDGTGPASSFAAKSRPPTTRR